MSGGIEQVPHPTSAATVPTISNSGLESGSVTEGADQPKQSVIGDPQTAGTTAIEPLEKEGDLINASNTDTKGATGMSATQLLGSASATIQQAAGTTAQTAQDLANQAFDAVMGGKAEESK